MSDRLLADRLHVGRVSEADRPGDWGSSGARSTLIFRACPVVVLPGYSRPLIRVEDYRELIEASTYRGDRVR